MHFNPKSNKELLEVISRSEFELPTNFNKIAMFKIRSKSTNNFKKLEKCNPDLHEILLNLEIKKCGYDFYKKKIVVKDPPKKNAYFRVTLLESGLNRGNIMKGIDFGKFRKTKLNFQKKHFKFLTKKLEPVIETVYFSQLAKYRKMTLFSPVFINSRSFLPVSEHASMNVWESESGPKMLIFGGLGNGINFDFVTFDLLTQNFESVKVNNNIHWARYGHTATVVSREKVVIFGGDKHFRRIINPLENSNQTHVNQNFWQVDISAGIAEEIRSDSCKKPKHRKFHGTCLFDKNYLLVFGGMKINYKFMNDFWIYDVEERVWHEFPVDFEVNTFLEYGIAHHSLVYMSSEITHLSKTDHFNSGKSSGQNESEKAKKAIYLFKNHKKNILLDVYLFGGMNEASDIIDNKVWRLGMKNHEFYFKEIPVRGCLPKKRHSQTMNAYPKEKMLIMIGGKSESGLFLKDVNLFHLQTSFWESCTLLDGSFENGIAGHCAEVLDNCVFVFGGITNEGFRVPGITYFAFANS